ncbi:MAG TPA: hypothetical protein VNW06_07235 [Cytophagaceae bacterium]|jgi:protein TonB|nr:hypothetical protein [Cytophagaceae bacterium]
MEDTTEVEKKNKRKGLAIAVGLHAALLLLFFFTIAWRTPNPPPKGIEGAEINLGFVDAGSGDEQANVDQVSEELPTDPHEEVIEEENIVSEEKFVSSDVESDYKVKEDVEKKEIKKEKTEPAKEKKETANPNNEYKSNSKSDGDRGVNGDQGKPNGNPDSRNYYTEGKGNKGNGPDATGGLLNLPGWVFDYIPKEADKSSESGYVVFQFKINETGKVESVKKMEDRNLSPTTIEFYRKKLLTSTFKPKNANVEPETGQTGTLRINVNAK